MGATGDPRRESFEYLLRDSDPDIRVVAAKELIHIGSVQSIPSLVDALRDENVYVRTASHRALMLMGAPTIEVLLTRLASKDDLNRFVIATHLAASITPDTEKSIPMELLERILSETRFVRCLGDFCIQSTINPSYPSLARVARITGQVFLEFSIRDGHPDETVASGHPLLTTAAKDELSQFRFVPRNSQNRYHMTFEFDLVGSTYQEVATGCDFVFPNYVRISSQIPSLVSTSTAQQAAGADR
jgi:hypothetical protein